MLTIIAGSSKVCRNAGRDALIAVANTSNFETLGDFADLRDPGLHRMILSVTCLGLTKEGM